MSFGTKLLKNRLKCKLTTPEMAALLGISQGTYHNWESDKTSLPAKYLPELAEIFKVDVTELIPNYTGSVVRIMNNQDLKNNDNAIVGFEVKIDKGELYEKILESKEEIIALQKAEIKRLKTQIEALER